MKYYFVICIVLLLTNCNKDLESNHQSPTLEKTEINVLNPTSNLSSYFGKAMDWNNNQLVISQGAFKGNGSVLNFYNAGNSSVPKLFQVIELANTNYPHIGYDVSLDGNSLIVSGYNGEQGGNTVFFEFIGSKWEYRSVFKSTNNKFGRTVKLIGNISFISNHLEQIGQFPNAGSVSIFERQGTDWNQIKNIQAPDFKNGDQFGWDFDYKDSLLIVGAPFADDGGKDRGSAYIFKFEKDSVVFKAKLLNLNGYGNDHFGYSVCISSKYFYVGAPDKENGKIYVFDRASYKQIAQFTCNSCTFFGKTIENYSDKVYVSSKRSGMLGAGRIYVYNEINKFNLDCILIPSTPYLSFEGTFGDHICITPFLVFVSYSEDSSCYYFKNN